MQKKLNKKKRAEEKKSLGSKNLAKPEGDQCLD